MLPLAAQLRLNRKSELQNMWGHWLSYTSRARSTEHLVQYRTHSAIHSSNFASLPLRFFLEVCTIHQISHNRHHGHILDFLPLPADRSTSSRLQPAAASNPKQDRRIALSWLRAATSVKFHTNFFGLVFDAALTGSAYYPRWCSRYVRPPRAIYRKRSIEA